MDLAGNAAALPMLPPLPPPAPPPAPQGAPAARSTPAKETVPMQLDDDDAAELITRDADATDAENSLPETDPA